jgi:hypothetical protein
MTAQEIRLTEFCAADDEVIDRGLQLPMNDTIAQRPSSARSAAYYRGLAARGRFDAVGYVNGGLVGMRGSEMIYVLEGRDWAEGYWG